MANKESSSATVRPGTLFHGRYRVQEVLARGGMATIYLAVDEETDDKVAIKVLYRRYSDNTVVRARFLDEGRIQAMLDHPNIVSVRDVIDEPVLSFVMEYVDGETLENYLQRRGPLDEDQLLEMMMPVMSAVGFAHGEGIIHRDLKPSNILLANPDGRLEPRVMDFGVAKVSRTKELTQDGTTVGTLHYMSPEQIVGSQDIDGRADIYSLGCSLYKLSTGEVPFNASSEFALMMAQVEAPPTPPSELRPEISEPLEQLILKALSKRPAQRFQTIKQMTSALMGLEGSDDPDDTVSRQVPGELLDFALKADEVARDQTDQIRLASTTDPDDRVEVDEEDVERTTSTMELSSTAVQKIEEDRLRAARRNTGDTRSMPGVDGDDSTDADAPGADETIDDSFDPDRLDGETVDDSFDPRRLAETSDVTNDDPSLRTTERNPPDIDGGGPTIEGDVDPDRLRASDGEDDSSRGVVAVENPDVDSREVTDLHNRERLRDGDPNDSSSSSRGPRDSPSSVDPDDGEPDTLRDSPSAIGAQSPAPEDDERMSTERNIPAPLRDDPAPETDTTDESGPTKPGPTARQRPAAIDDEPTGNPPSKADDRADDSSDQFESARGYSEFRSTPQPTVDTDDTDDVDTADETGPPIALLIAVGVAAVVVALLAGLWALG